jgi:hypothetical protein
MKNYLTEREGQANFFNDLKIKTDVELSNNTDGVYRGTIFEFKKNISDINKVLFQAIKYLSHLRIKGESIPASILLVALNEEVAYLFNSSEYLADIEKIYAGSASKNNEEFIATTEPERINYSKIEGLNRLTQVLQIEKFIQIHIDVFDVVGWASRYYRENPSANKIDFFSELKRPELFKKYIFPWTGAEQDFKYIMDLLNDKQHKKELGAFYTPALYCHKATELVRKAISQIPENNDYIILDRCAGTGNLEEFLTDKPVSDIVIGELIKYLDEDTIREYLKDKKNIISTFYNDVDFNSITVGELEKYKTKLTMYDYLFDDELSHTIVNTYELKEWIVLNERVGDKVKLIIPPPSEIDNTQALVEGGNALSPNFILGQQTHLIGEMTTDYYESIKTLTEFINDPRMNVILYENPPYRDSSAANSVNETNKTNKGTLVFESMKKDLDKLPNSNISTARDVSNQFIWSGWKYYLKKPDDSYILFSPIKYWKSLGLCEKHFIEGFLFNREFFHANPSAISCILWNNRSESREELPLQVYDIVEKKVYEQTSSLSKLNDILVKKVKTTLTPLYEKRVFSDDSPSGVYCDTTGYEAFRRTSTKALYNKNIIGYMFAGGYSVDAKHITLVRSTIFNGRGFYLRTDNFLDKLPLFAAKLFPQKRWYEKDVYFTTSDGGDKYLHDQEFLKRCLILTCLSQKNHCCSFMGSDGRHYLNELCLDDGTVASRKLSEFNLTEMENELIKQFNDILLLAKHTSNYNSSYSYGPYQINKEINTFVENDDGSKVYDHPEINTKIISLKKRLYRYYEEMIEPKLFEYELLK